MLKLRLLANPGCLVERTGKAINFIYEKLVTSGDDLVGLIAYGIYKKYKIEFITKIKENQGRKPTDEECQTFYAASTTESQLGPRPSRNYIV